MTQEPPFTVHMEPTEGCSLACSFCGLQAVRNNGADADKGIHGKVSTPYLYMSPLLAVRIADEIKRLGWNPRIEYTGRGEPTMNPEIEGLIAIFRSKLPKSSITLTSNGSGLLKKEKLQGIFEAGLNTLAFDDYKHAPWRERINPLLEEFAEHEGIKLHEYPADLDGNPHRRFFGRRITRIHDISDNTIGTHKLTNQAGNSFMAVSKSLDQRCAKPFREFTIRWDGNVAVCCDDWRGVYKVSNVINEPLDVVWNHPRFQAARKVIFQGDRAHMEPCRLCNVKTFRNGLLPDKKGQYPLLPPTEEDFNLIAEALAGDPYSQKLG
jgi:radical SAM protein with 4Fe4S-binding SPASM domain